MSEQPLAEMKPLDIRPITRGPLERKVTITQISQDPIIQGGKTNDEVKETFRKRLLQISAAPTSPKIKPINSYTGEVKINKGDSEDNTLDLSRIDGKEGPVADHIELKELLEQI